MPLRIENQLKIIKETHNFQIKITTKPKCTDKHSRSSGLTIAGFLDPDRDACAVFATVLGRNVGFFIIASVYNGNNFSDSGRISCPDDDAAAQNLR
jgi:hypothetical protein